MHVRPSASTDLPIHTPELDGVPERWCGPSTKTSLTSTCLLRAGGCAGRLLAQHRYRAYRVATVGADAARPAALAQNCVQSGDGRLSDRCGELDARQMGGPAMASPVRQALRLSTAVPDRRNGRGPGRGRETYLSGFEAPPRATLERSRLTSEVGDRPTDCRGLAATATTPSRTRKVAAAPNTAPGSVRRTRRRSCRDSGSCGVGKASLREGRVRRMAPRQCELHRMAWTLGPCRLDDDRKSGAPDADYSTVACKRDTQGCKSWCR